jgi:hypothetical protein
MCVVCKSSSDCVSVDGQVQQLCALSLLQLDYDLATLDLPGGFITGRLAAGYEALAGLTDLQVRTVEGSMTSRPLFLVLACSC